MTEEEERDRQEEEELRKILALFDDATVKLGARWYVNGEPQGPIDGMWRGNV